LEEKEFDFDQFWLSRNQSEILMISVTALMQDFLLHSK